MPPDMAEAVKRLVAPAEAALGNMTSAPRETSTKKKLVTEMSTLLGSYIAWVNSVKALSEEDQHFQHSLDNFNVWEQAVKTRIQEAGSSGRGRVPKRLTAQLQKAARTRVDFREAVERRNALATVLNTLGENVRTAMKQWLGDAAEQFVQPWRIAEKQMS